MQRRNFIRNTGLGLAGLTFSRSLWANLPDSKKTIDICIVMSGGIQFHDIIDLQNSKLLKFFLKPYPINITCYTNLVSDIKCLEHEQALNNFCKGIAPVSNELLFVGSSASDSFTKISKPFPCVIAVDPKFSSKEAHLNNDAAVINYVLEYLDNIQTKTLIICLEDTDVAHYNHNKYLDVLNLYSYQFNALCKKLFSPEILNHFNPTLKIFSVLGRNNFENEIGTSANDRGGSDHYDVSASSLFSIEVVPSNSFQIEFNHQMQILNDLRPEQLRWTV